MPITNIVCIICLEFFKNSDDVHSTSCGHLFHFHCLSEWQRRNYNCPQCRLPSSQSHKIYLSFEETAEIVEQVENPLETQLKLKTSKEKIIELQAQLTVAERQFMHLQEQLNINESSKADLEVIFSQIYDYEEDLLALQGQYTISSEHMKVLEQQICNLSIKDECSSKEQNLLTLKNGSLTASSSAEQSFLPKGILHDKVNILEQKIKHISEELEKETCISTKLSIENKKLQNSVNHLSSVEKPNSERDNKNTTHFEPNLERVKGNTAGDIVSSNSVIIKQFPMNLLLTPLKNVIVNLAAIMNVGISLEDLSMVEIAKTNDAKSKKAQIYVEFKSCEKRDKFLSNRTILKTYKTYISVEILNLHELFMYAKEKIQFTKIFYKNYKIFAKKENHFELFHIQSKSQVDSLQQLFK